MLINRFCDVLKPDKGIEYEQFVYTVQLEHQRKKLTFLASVLCIGCFWLCVAIGKIIVGHSNDW
jgi:hypothetical protein